MRTIHVVGWAVVASSGCGRENVEGDDCSPGPVIREVALDEPSVTGAVPLDVLERVNRTVSGRFDVSRVFREAGAPGELPGALSLAFTPSATPTDREAKPECNVGVHLNWPGRSDSQSAIPTAVPSARTLNPHSVDNSEGGRTSARRGRAGGVAAAVRRPDRDPRRGR